ncbi:MAG: nitrile hydratase subunit beta [Alphaproteobacteria bacterium]|jgi:nitrile hydratase subunit beta|nr:nitrile hydratase subunit beta [Alphaproteobacteria bacterium]MBT4019886.1 nitrile hydratase subunit beta [Alphaproteobacteria bacterium]MBT4965772.1 nitrile hydratase subunit beta [Alphaproteobacteria bacterium]MBT5917627.1 nitrile hydratase subunit beta [Alphaproteobacteria bacterium]MBT7747408.1 nitrile hydratase subunit beta [Alphaproteobacteria bacterium]
MSTETIPPRFGIGDTVRVKSLSPEGHMRTPWYIRGKVGVIGGLMGSYWNPEESAMGRDGKPDRMVYHVHFDQARLWPDYNGRETDQLVVDLQDHWLDIASPQELEAGNLS